MYFLCSFSFHKPLEFAALSAMTMTSFIPTGVFPGKVFILKKCHCPMKKLLCWKLLTSSVFWSNAKAHLASCTLRKYWIKTPVIIVFVLLFSPSSAKYIGVGAHSSWRGMANCLWSFVLAYPADTLVAEAYSSFSECFLGQKLAKSGRSSIHSTSTLSVSSV